jgi:hypothetical protein
MFSISGFRIRSQLALLTLRNGNAIRGDSKIRRDTLAFPVAESGRLRAVRTLKLFCVGDRLCFCRGSRAACFGFGQRALRRRRQNFSGHCLEGGFQRGRCSLGGNVVHLIFLLNRHGAVRVTTIKNIFCKNIFRKSMFDCEHIKAILTFGIFACDKISPRTMARAEAGRVVACPPS